MRVASLALAAWLAALSLARAGELQLYPLRMELSPSAPISAFRMTNQADTESRLQIQVMAWSQGPDGDVMSPTDDILLNPPLFALEKRSEQTIRVGLADRSPVAVEKAYRIFFQEVPAARQKSGIATLLRLSVPIFVPPVRPQLPALRFAMSPDGALRIANTGNTHVQITRLSARKRAADGQGMSVYVLPGATATWQPSDGNLKYAAGEILTAETDAGPVTATLMAADARP